LGFKANLRTGELEEISPEGGYLLAGSGEILNILKLILEKSLRE